MIKLNFKYLLVILSIITTALSCSKDKGNYDYTALDAVTIDISNIPNSYSLLRFENLDITPTVTYKGQKVDPTKPQFDELSYTWEMYPSQAYKEVIDRSVLSNDFHLNTAISQRELTWELLFTVTNKNTGVKAFAKFNVIVTPSLSEGWMVLYERNGNSDVGLIVNDEISKAATKEKLFLDIYSASNGKELEGTPGSIIYSKSNFPTAVSIFIQTSKNIANVNSSTFQAVSTAAKGIFWTPPATISPAFVTASEGRKDLLMNNNKLHTIDYTIIAPGDRSFGDAIGGTYGKLAPWMPSSTSTAFDAIVYDQTNQNFKKVINRGAEIIPLATVQSTTAPFDVRNVGLEFVMSDIGWNNWEHMVMKNSAGKYFLLTANFREGETAVIGKGKYDMSNCPEVSAINSITAGVYGEIFYYSANNHLYQFKYTPNTTDLLWTAPENEKITAISLQKYMNTNRAAGVLYDPKNLCKILYIATYNEATQMGTVYQMGVNQTSGAILAGTEKKYTGFGKVKAMAWKLGIK
ncbi:PKD-like family lipoprotein [Pedobacter sp. MW01-1-1]|uniref:PKD-like family lipoprotein n=1 Tax=Pedobacter sp. MW01-1-1 TaxID=3383027 RepID=UPI003FF0E666